MNNGLLVVIALFLIYLAVTGKYNCVTAAAKCVFSGAKLCECGVAGGAPVAGTRPDAVKGAVDHIMEQGRRIRGIIDAARGRK